MITTFVLIMLSAQEQPAQITLPAYPSYASGDCLGWDYKPAPCPPTAASVNAKVIELEVKVAIQQKTLEGVLKVLKEIVADRERVAVGITRIQNHMSEGQQKCLDAIKRNRLEDRAACEMGLMVDKPLASRK